MQRLLKSFYPEMGSAMSEALLRHLVLVMLSPVFGFAQTEKLPRWQKGFMDIHHISTGRGNATFMVFPDGTTMLFDAGEISDTHPRTRSTRNSSPRPDSTRPAHEWVARYILEFSPPGRSSIDYGVVSHFHDDHFGEWDEGRKRSLKGDYVLTGIVGVGDAVPIGRIFDRGHSDPVDLKSPGFRERFARDEYHIVQTLGNYFSFLNSQVMQGRSYDTVVVGANDQFRLLYDTAGFPEWRVMNIAGAGRVATGFANRESVRVVRKGEYPGENPLSVCLKISYGRFDYFTGGDIAGIDDLGGADFHSMESQVAPVVGPVDVATLNHHGNRDSQQPYYVRALRPRVWIQQTWSSDHPGHDVLRRIMSQSIYPGERDLFSTDLLVPNIDVIGEPAIARAYKSRNGHVVVRVAPRGDRYSVFVLDDRDKDYRVVSQHGPYLSR